MWQSQEKEDDDNRKQANGYVDPETPSPACMVHKGSSDKWSYLFFFINQERRGEERRGIKKQRVRRGEEGKGEGEEDNEKHTTLATAKTAPRDPRYLPRSRGDVTSAITIITSDCIPNLYH